MNQIYEIHKNTQESNIQSKSQPTIKNQLFNKAENAAKIIAQVMAIEKIETRLPKIGGWNEYLIQSEFKQQNRFINQLQIKHTNIEKCQELESALSDYRQIINLFTNLISQENSSYILSISTSSEIQTIKPAFNLLNLLDNFHLQSIIDFHNVLQNDPKGEELKENIINYQQKLSQYLYFHLIQEEDPNLKLLLTLVLMNHTQNNQKILQILNNYINSFDKFEKQKVVNFLKHIISIFDELSEYFNILIQVINDQSIQIDRKLQLNKKQFEIILLILDNSNYHSQQQSILLHLSIASSDVIRSIKWIYNPECSQEFVISQQKELTNNLSIKVDQNILQDLFLLLQKLRSVKLRLLIERIIEFHQKKEREIRLEFLEFNIFLPQDQETLNNIEFAYSNQIQIQQLPFNRFQSDLLVNNTIYSFSKILNLVAQCDKEQSNQNGQLFNTKAKMELKQLISDQIANFGAQYLPNLLPCYKLN